MKTSFKLLKVAGIQLELHFTFLLLLSLYVIFDIGFIPVFIILFTSVVLHELSHSLVAKAHGIMVSRIILSPIGGMASMRAKRLKPQVEFVMSLAGPLFNLVVCAIVSIASRYNDILYGWEAWQLMMSGDLVVAVVPFLLTSVFWVNLMLALFNLFVMAIPMDGGRVLRSFLSMFIGYVRATKIATYVSMVLSTFMFLLGLLFGNLVLVAIAIFVFLAAKAELDMVVSSAILSKLLAAKLVRRDLIFLPGEMTLDKAIVEMAKQRLTVVFITTDSKYRLASIYSIAAVPKEKWQHVRLSQVAHAVRPIAPETSLDEAMRRMYDWDGYILPVVAGTKLVGCIHKEDIDRLLQILKVMGS